MLSPGWWMLVPRLIGLIHELDHHRGSEGQESLGYILVEDGLCLEERPVRSVGWVEGGLSSVVELVGDKGLEVKDQG